MLETTYNNYHLSFEPTKSDEIWGQPNVVALIDEWVRNNSHPTFITFIGSSGVGKTSAAKVLINSTHCINRKDGDIYPCGHCAICKSDPYFADYNRNVVWVKAGTGQTDESAHKQISNALSLAEQGPISSGDLNDSHRDVLFIVLEEMHNIPSNLLNKAFSFGDVEARLRGKVCFIGVTMSPERFTPELKKAITHRGCKVDFRKPTNAEIQEYIEVYYEGIPKESAKLIASASENSYRGALSYTYTCLKVLGTNDHTLLYPDRVANILQLTPKEMRMNLWRMLEGVSTYRNADIANYLKDILPFTVPIELAKQLVEDVVDSLESGYVSLDDYKYVIKQLYQFILNPGLFTINTVLYSLRGIKIVNAST